MHYARSGEVECVSTHTRTFQKLRRKYWSRTLRVVCRQLICRLVSSEETQFIDKLAGQHCCSSCLGEARARVSESLTNVIRCQGHLSVAPAQKARASHLPRVTRRRRAQRETVARLRRRLPLFKRLTSGTTSMQPTL